MSSIEKIWKSVWAWIKSLFSKDKTPKTTLTGQETGFLWKPKGEHSGALRVLLPPEFTGKTLKYIDLFKDGNKIEVLSYLGLGNPVRGMDREHYQGSKEGGKYPSGTQVQVIADSIRWQWIVNRSSQRNENLKATIVK